METNGLKEKILSKINRGEVKMKPRLYFFLTGILFLIIFSFFFIISFFLVSFIHFHLISSGIWYLPHFGAKGVLIFFKSLPWALIILTIILILLLEFLSRKFSFSFKKPILISLLIIIFLVFLGSFFVTKGNIHPRLLLRAKERKIPLLEPLYLKYSAPRFPEFHRGAIEKVSTSSLFIRGMDERLIEVKLEKPLPSSERLKEGEGIIIFGEKEDGKMRAKKWKKIKDEILPFERKMLGPHFRMK